MGYLLASPLRKLVENPERLLGPLVRPRMTVLEPGCGMGFFSLPLARLVGPEGLVVCVDVQRKMIDGLRRRAQRAGLLDRIATVVCSPTDLGAAEWEGRIDLVVAIHVVHEVPDTARFMTQATASLRPSGKLLILEPPGHVGASQFAQTISAAEGAGLARGEAPRVRGDRAALLWKTDGKRKASV